MELDDDLNYSDYYDRSTANFLKNVINMNNSKKDWIICI